MNKYPWLCIGLIIVASNFPYAQSSARFSSAYTNLKNCGSGLTPKQEKELARQGQDIPSICRGLGGFSIALSSDGAHTQFQLRTKAASDVLWAENLYVGDRILDRQIEWRMANGKPFAVIFRREIWEEGDKGWKKIGEEMVVKGLSGFEDLDQTIKVKRNSNANIEARQVADDFYRSKK